MKRVAVLQSGYIPWKGYFDLINSVDLFIWYDDVQYTRQDWRNRNLIKTARGKRWLTVPCGSKINRLINEVELSDAGWQQSHWQTLCEAYDQAPHFAEYRDLLEQLYLGRRWRWLYEMNRAFVENICRQVLNIRTPFDDSSNYTLKSRGAERLLDLLEQVGADCYLSGPAARAYIDEEVFRERGIDLRWMDYGGYPSYPQLHGPFAHQVTVLDLLFHVGAEADWFVWGWRGGPAGEADAARRGKEAGSGLH